MVEQRTDDVRVNAVFVNGSRCETAHTDNAPFARTLFERTLLG